MKPEFFKEREYYSISGLADKLNVKNEDEAKKLVGVLKKYGIVKAVNKDKPIYSELSNENIVIADSEDNSSDICYIFDFVGIVSIKGHALKCYPKYINKSEKILDKQLKTFKKVLKVIQKYNSKEHLLYLFSGEDGDRIFNKMVVEIHLLEEYLNYGLYVNEQEIIETNGDGDIIWNRTIDETYAIIKDNQPFYVELQTRRNIADDIDYFKRLHECILTACSNELHRLGILELFDLPLVEFTRDNLADFGDIDYILYRLEKEIQVQFVTRKQILLKTLYTYIAKSKTDKNDDSLSFFGTNSFNLIWERACAEVFKNKLKTPIKDLGIVQDFDKLEYKPDDLLIDIIDKPTWYVGKEKKEVRDTLKPDIIACGMHDNKNYFIILDAKYYDMTLKYGEPIVGNPGVSDVTKQYLYQLAYQGFINTLGRNTIVYNCFLMPTEEEKVIGHMAVRLDMLKKLDLKDIQVRYMPADKVYEKYLSGEHLDVLELFDNCYNMDSNDFIDNIKI